MLCLGGFYLPSWFLNRYQHLYWFSMVPIHNYHKLDDSNTNILAHSSVVQVSSTGFCPKNLKAKIKVSGCYCRN